MAEAIRSELVEAGRASSGLGRQALDLAKRIDQGADTASGIAALHRELRVTMEAALSAAKRESPVDELRRKRLERVGRGA